MIHRYLDPKNDLAFKKVFGSEKHKQIPINFLNAVFNLSGDDLIIDLEFLNTNQLPKIAAKKESIVDVLVRDQKGTHYIVEMQVAKIAGFEKRAQYYAAKTYCAHFDEGDDYPNLTKVIFLAITDYIVFPNKQGYKSEHVILDNESYEHDLKDFSFTFVELPKFRKENHELISIEDKWYYFLKHADESNNINEILASNPEIQEAYDVLDRFKWTEVELNHYENIVMRDADERGIINAAKIDGREEGLKAGLEEGLKKGFEEGAKCEKEKLAVKLLNMELSVEQVQQATTLSIEEINQLLSTQIKD